MFCFVVLHYLVKEETILCEQYSTADRRKTNHYRR